jgi:hypothetical protein
MSKYMVYGRRPEKKPRPWKVHPIWRGIGCVMIILIPLMSYAGAILLIQANFAKRWIPLPVEFARSVRILYLGVVPHLLATVVVTILLMMVGFAAIMAFYGMMYRFMGPPALGPLDAPPESPTRKRTKRG